MNRVKIAAQQGFTLLELLVAFAIMAISLGMLYRAVGSSAHSVGVIELQERALVLAESLLTLRDSVPPDGWNQAGESAGYRWHVTSTPYPTGVEDPKTPLLQEVHVDISWSDDGQTHHIELNTLKPQRKLPAGSGL